MKVNIDPETLKTLQNAVHILRGYEVAGDTDPYSGTMPFKLNKNKWHPTGRGSLKAFEALHAALNDEDKLAYDGQRIFKFSPNVIKHLDPDFYTVRDLYRQHIVSNEHLFPTQKTQLSSHLKHMTPRFFKNFVDIPDDRKGRALSEVLAFFNDNGYRLEDDTKIESLGNVRRLIEQFQEADARDAQVKQVDKYIRNHAESPELRAHFPDEYVNVPAKRFAFYDDGRIAKQQVLHPGNPLWDNPTKYSDGEYFLDTTTNKWVNVDDPTFFESIVAELKREEDAPYEYNENVKAEVERTGWRLFESPEDMTKVGEELDHCYGNVKHYGPKHRKQYINKIRSKQSILLTKGNISAEIALDTNKDGEIVDAQIVQIQAPSNERPENYNELRAELEPLSRFLVGHNVNQLTPEQVDNELSDILCKHIISKAPAHLVNAVHRRF